MLGGLQHSFARAHVLDVTLEVGGDWGRHLHVSARVLHYVIGWGGW